MNKSITALVIFTLIIIMIPKLDLWASEYTFKTTFDNYSHNLPILKKEKDYKKLSYPIPGPFSCISEFYLTLDGDLNILDPFNISGGMSLLYNIGYNVNATGYNPLDDYIYVIKSSDRHVQRLHSDGMIEDLGDIGLPVNPFVGAFDPDGLWHIKAGGTTVYLVDVVSLSYTEVTLSSNFAPADWSYHYEEDLFYGVSGTTLYSYDPASLSVQTIPVTGFQSGDGGTFGATFYTSDGYIYVLNNTSGRLYKIDVNLGEATFVFQGQGGLSSVDGCSCPTAPPPPPVVIANPDSLCLEESGQQSHFILENDIVYFGTLDYSSFSIITPPEHGSITYDATSGEVIYIANSTLVEDSLIYEICSEGDIVVCDQATIYIFPPEEITFDEFGPFCLGDEEEILPPFSNEGISGSWEPSTISTSSVGTSFYTFTPDLELYFCAFPYTTEITVNDLDYPTFSSLGFYCQYEEPNDLPETSNNGISGTWIPESINTGIWGDFTFVFIPDLLLHPCAQEIAVTIFVYEEVSPSFDNIEPYCVGQEADVLPWVSNEGIIGNWSPDEVNTDASGTFTFTFTPEEALHPCALEQNIEITILENITPSFDPIANFCLNDEIIDLPEFSNEGISGTWIPHIIDTSFPGEHEYIFIPDGNIEPCALVVSLFITVEDAIIPVFEYPEAFCLDAEALPLPEFSMEGYSGNWFPAEVSTGVSGIFHYEFIPDNLNEECLGMASIFLAIMPEIDIELIDKVCAPDLDTYEILVEISGGSGVIDSIEADGYEVVHEGGNNYTILNVASGTGLELVVWDDANCSNLLNLLPYDCNCPDVDDPSGGEGLKYCSGTSIGSISIDDPGPGNQVNWYNDQGILLSHANPFIPPGPGTYMATLMDILNGCESNNPEFVTVIEIPPLEIDIIDVLCAENLLTYDLVLLISGGSGVFDQIFAQGYNIIDNGNGNYVIEDILNNTGIDIELLDNEGCSLMITSPSHNCACPEILAPTGEQELFYCFGDEIPSLQVDDPGSAYNIVWYDEHNNILGGGIRYNVGSPGLYYAQIIDITNNCFSDLTPFELTENAELNLEVLSAVCENEIEPYNLLLTINGGSPDYDLNAGDLNVLQNNFNEFIIENISDLSGLNLLITDSFGCSIESWVAPALLQAPEANAGINQTISCLDGKAVLNGASNVIDITCLWDGPDDDFVNNTAEIVVQSSGLYYINVTDNSNGCSALDSVYVFDAQFPIFDTKLDEVQCHGENNGMITFENVYNGSPPYSYSIDGGITFSEIPFFENLAPGEFDLLLIDQNGCWKDSTITIFEPEALELNLETDITLYLGEKYQVVTETNLDQGDIASILWTPETGLSCSNCLEPIANPENSITYVLELIDHNGCKVLDTLVILRDKNFEVYVPNVFSPNGDEMNEVFYIKAGKGVEIIESLEIFGRWGNKVFALQNFLPNDPAYGWDGKYQSQNVNPGVFIYCAKVLIADGTRIILSGDITLLR